MYEVNPVNPYTPDIDFTQVLLLLALKDKQPIPTVLEDYEPLRKLLEDLEDKGYLYRSRLFDYKHIGWRLTPIGENRIEVYKTYPNLLPYDLVSTKSLQILLGKVREEITHTILEKYSRYMFACEALIVNILNNHV